MCSTHPPSSSRLLHPFSLIRRGLVIIQSVLCCVFQSLIYPMLMSKLKVPIPYLALTGMIIEFFAYLLITVDSEYGSMAATLLLWIGFSMAAPTSVSIISVSEGVMMMMIRPLHIPVCRVRHSPITTSSGRLLSFLRLSFSPLFTSTTRSGSMTSPLSPPSLPLLYLVMCARGIM